MRVIVVSHAYPRRDATSHGIFVHRLNMGLRSFGIDVHVLQLADWAPPYPLSEMDRAWRTYRNERRAMYSSIDGIIVHHPTVFTPRPSRFFRVDSWERQSKAVIDYCRRRSDLASADIVLAHFMVPDGYHALRLARTLGIPSIAMAHGDDIHAWPTTRADWKSRLKKVLQEIDVPIACAKQMVLDANQWLAAPRQDWQVVYCGVDLDQFFPVQDQRRERTKSLPQLNFTESDRILLTLGTPTYAKGYMELIEAWARVAPYAPKWHLVMGGANRTEIDVPAEIAHKGLSGRAYWIGLQPSEAIPSLLRACDAFALPSHNEGLSLSVLEAMASGLPTVATNVGGHSEVITSDSEGWLIPPRDVDKLEGALRELTSSEEERTRRGRGARIAAARFGGPHDNAKRLADILERTTKRHPLTAVT